MPSSRHNERIVRFGLFEFRPDTKELRKGGLRIRVQAKPLQILRTLIDRPGELISRDELQKELWPDGTFVDFESGLNTATNRLRAALNDSAEQPRYIETLPRLGYRFICPVQELGVSGVGEVANSPQTSPSTEIEFETKPPHLVQSSSPDEVRSKSLRSAFRYALLTLFAVAAVTGLALYSRVGKDARAAQVSFHPLTYRPEVIYAARFLPGAESAVYSTYSEPDGIRTLRLKVEGNNPQPAVVDEGTLVSVSPSGDLVVRTHLPHDSGTQLSQVSLSGKKVSLDAKNARGAEWFPDGRHLALLRRIGIEWVVEFPAGHIAYRCDGSISDLRVSPDGNWVAFIEHPMRDDDRGHIRVVDKSGKTRELTADWSSAVGLAWSHSGNEIWFTASKTGVVRNLYAVSKSGVLRRLSNAPASLRLFDIAADGRLLLSVDDIRGAMLARFPGSHEAADVSQFDEPNVQAISSDGQRILFTESGDAGGQHYKALLLDNANHSSHIIGSGRAMGISPDGRQVLLLDPQDNRTLAIVPLQGGASKRISGGGLHYQWARFLSPDVLLAGASFSTGPLMLYRQSLDGSSPTALTGLPYLDYPAIAPDRCRAVGRSATDVVLVNFCQKTAEPLHVPAGAVPAAWSADGTSVVLALTSEMPPALVKLDLRSNSLTKWKPLYIPQASFSAQLTSIAAAPEAGAYAYSVEERLSRLYIVDGWS